MILHLSLMANFFLFIAFIIQGRAVMQLRADYLDLHNEFEKGLELMKQMEVMLETFDNIATKEHIDASPK